MPAQSCKPAKETTTMEDMSDVPASLFTPKTDYTPEKLKICFNTTPGSSKKSVNEEIESALHAQLCAIGKLFID